MRRAVLRLPQHSCTYPRCSLAAVACRRGEVAGAVRSGPDRKIAQQAALNRVRPPLSRLRRWTIAGRQSHLPRASRRKLAPHREKNTVRLNAITRKLKQTEKQQRLSPHCKQFERKSSRVLSQEGALSTIRTICISRKETPSPTPNSPRRSRSAGRGPRSPRPTPLGVGA